MVEYSCETTSTSHGHRFTLEPNYLALISSRREDTKKAATAIQPVVSTRNKKAQLATNI
jgi:hypothetical protein